LSAIGQQLGFDLALEQIIRRLYHVQLGNAVVEERLHGFGRLLDLHQRIGPMHLIEVDVVSLHHRNESAISRKMRSRLALRKAFPSVHSSPVLLAITTRERRRPSATARPTISSERPNPYAGAVSIRVIPRSTAAWIVLTDSTSCALPHVQRSPRCRGQRATRPASCLQ
jgi:predicted sugar kinase